MIFTEEKATNLNFPNITVQTRLRDGEPCAYIAVANDGYVIYDTTAENYEQKSPDTDPEKVIHYYNKIICPLSYDFNKFPWEAVPIDSASSNHIF